MGQALPKPGLRPYLPADLPKGHDQGEEKKTLRDAEGGEQHDQRKHGIAKQGGHAQTPKSPT